jgi:hypothetical protein
MALLAAAACTPAKPSPWENLDYSSAIRTNGETIE